MIDILQTLIPYVAGTLLGWWFGARLGYQSGVDEGFDTVFEQLLDEKDFLLVSKYQDGEYGYTRLKYVLKDNPEIYNNLVNIMEEQVFCKEKDITGILDSVPTQGEEG